MPKLVRITTVPVSLQVLLKGQMRFMSEQGFDVTMISAAGPEVEALKAQESCPHIAVPFTRTISPFKDLACLFRLVRIFRELKPDIVHTHTPKAGLLGMLAARIAGVPVRLHTVAGLPWMESKGMMRKLLAAMEKLTAWSASRIYPNSNLLRNFLEREGLPPAKMKVLGKGSSNGIPARYFTVDEGMRSEAEKLKNSKGVGEDGIIWIFIGRLVTDKGIGELLDAFSAIHQRYPSDRLWLLGNEEPELDPLQPRYRDMLHSHNAITCWGFQKDIRPYLAAASVLVFPSYREGFPNVPMQAGSMGCALILSDINGCNEIVDNGINGLLVPVKDTAALQSAMEDLRARPDKRKGMAMAFREKIVRDFDQEALWNLILEEYRYWLHEKNKS